MHEFYEAFEKEVTEGRRAGGRGVRGTIGAAIVVVAAGAGLLLANVAFPQRAECGPPIVFESVVFEKCPPKPSEHISNPLESTDYFPLWIGGVVGGFVGLLISISVFATKTPAESTKSDAAASADKPPETLGDSPTPARLE